VFIAEGEVKGRRVSYECKGRGGAVAVETEVDLRSNKRPSLGNGVTTRQSLRQRVSIPREGGGWISGYELKVIFAILRRGALVPARCS
jgi:hypothetical protein